MHAHIPLRLGLLGLMIATSACRTTADQDGDATKKDLAGLAGGVDLAKDEGQGLYLKMLETELASGVKVPKDQLHTSRGLVECRKEGELEPCSVRVRLGGGDLSGSQPMAPEVAGKTWAYIRAARPELGSESLVLADATCDYIGTKSPPYNVEDVRCGISLARGPDEAVFADRVSEDLGEALRGETPYGNSTVTVSGSVTCNWLPSTPRTPCVVRSIKGGVLAEKVTELDATAAAQAAKSLLQTLNDKEKRDGKPATTAPNQIVGAVTCLIDNTRIETDGKRGYVCRAKL